MTHKRLASSKPCLCHSIYDCGVNEYELHAMDGFPVYACCICCRYTASLNDYFMAEYKYLCAVSFVAVLMHSSIWTIPLWAMFNLFRICSIAHDGGEMFSVIQFIDMCGA